MPANKRRGRDRFSRYRTLIRMLVLIVRVFPSGIRIKLLEHYRMTKGIKGIVVRYVLLKSLAKYCGNNVSLHPGVYLFSPRKMSVGDNVSIHPMCYIDAAGGIEIGNDVSIAHAVTIMSTTHEYSEKDINIKDQPVVGKLTIIEDNVWIGAKATILAGNRVHTGSVIAACAVITKDTPQNSICAGVPARVIKYRS